MNQALEECRWVYNQTLALRKDAWEQEQKSIGTARFLQSRVCWQERSAG